MSRIRIIMLSLLAVFAVSAAASASASATCYRVAEAGTGNKDSSCTTNVAPTANEYINVTALETKLKPGEWCAKVKEVETGNYEDNACTKKVAKKEFIKVLVPEFVHCVTQAGGGFAAGCKVTGTTSEKVAVPAGSKIKFTSISEPGYLFANAAGSFKIRCGKDKDTGEITGPKTVANVTVTFEECKGAKGSEECSVKSSTPVGPAGTIITNTLSGEIGAVAAAEAPSSEVGLDLKATTGTSFVKLVGASETCIPETNVTGSVIGEYEPVKIMDTSGELIYGVKGGESKHNKQTIQRFVGGEKDTLTAFGVESGLETEDSIFYEENIEVT